MFFGGKKKKRIRKVVKKSNAPLRSTQNEVTQVSAVGSSKNALPPEEFQAFRAKRGMRLPIKFKFLFVILSIMSISLGTFFQYADKIFSEDKKLFIMDLNMASLGAAISDVKFEIKSRLEEVQVLAPRVYNQVPDKFQKFNQGFDPFQGLSKQLKEELIAITFYRQEKNGEIKQIRRFTNADRLKQWEIPLTFPVSINERHPINYQEYMNREGLSVLNRSMGAGTGRLRGGMSILSFIFGGSFVDADSRGVLIVVDMAADFLRKKLRGFDLAVVFLIDSQGHIVSHPQLEETIAYSSKVYPHPIVERLKKRHLAREGFELSVAGEPFLVNVSTTPFPDTFVVSQVQKSQAFDALYQLRTKSVTIGLIILFLAIIVSILFASRLTGNIQRLKLAADRVGHGDLDFSINIRSNDEIGEVYDSFTFMVGKLKALMSETANKARMENELRTAQVVQATLLRAPEIQNDAVRIEALLTPASEVGGDFWDAHLVGHKLNVIVGDATGHGAPAALVTAIAKSSFSTLHRIYGAHPLEPEQLVHTLNSIIYETCKGSLLMTGIVMQLDLVTGELKVCNAGHESPLCVRGEELSQAGSGTDKKKKKRRAEVFFGRGERLGFSSESSYTTETFQLSPGDMVMLYTDGITEAESPDGKEWGERSLSKTFANCAGMELGEVKQIISKEVLTHMNGREANDDLTFVLVSWTHPLPMESVQTDEVSWNDAHNIPDPVASHSVSASHSGSHSDNHSQSSESFPIVTASVEKESAGESETDEGAKSNDNESGFIMYNSDSTEDQIVATEGVSAIDLQDPDSEESKVSTAQELRSDFDLDISEEIEIQHLVDEDDIKTQMVDLKSIKNNEPQLDEDEEKTILAFVGKSDSEVEDEIKTQIFKLNKEESEAENKQDDDSEDQNDDKEKPEVA